MLQLTGKIEDYLTKEFICHLYSSTNGKNFALPNLGLSNERKLDICLLRGNAESPTIIGLIEVKYLRNKQRITKYDATDEISTELKNLSQQLGAFELETHYGWQVRLYSKQKIIYGLVFASYVTTNGNSGKEQFYDKILKRAKELYFKYHDKPKPYFDKVFDDVPAKVLNTTFYVSLRAGLWRKNNLN